MQIASNKIKDVIRYFREELKDTYERDELETILKYCFEAFLNVKRASLILKENDTISESELLKFNFAIKDLRKQKPIQYILGEADFYRLKFKVNEHVLIPRPETEELVDLIIKEYQVAGSKTQDSRQTTNILDIGTGSGCIAVALKKNISNANVSAMDVSKEALLIAKQNAQQNNVDVNFLLQNILSVENWKGNYDIIVSNPPYICLSEKESLHKNVVEHEPHLALFVNDDDPLLFYKSIAEFALKHLNKNGKLYFEINQAFALESKQILQEKGFKNVEVIKDLNNNYRILHGHI
jgi:release factor glutamine methyltransferase